jgi:tRNA (cytosine38-C5)-methyltransferase
MFCSHSLLSNCIHSKSLSFFCYLFSLFEGVKVEIEEGNPSSLVKLKLRYFTPREIANLHGFPSTFHFPPSFSLKQCFSLLGNSLNVVVVSELIDYLLLE